MGREYSYSIFGDLSGPVLKVDLDGNCIVCVVEEWDVSEQQSVESTVQDLELYTYSSDE